MGFLEVGTPLPWEDTPEYHALLDYVREHGVAQFLHVWSSLKDRRNDSLLWGDEIEYHLFRRLPATATSPHRAVVSNRAAEILKRLVEEDDALPEQDRLVTWHPEYGAWMVEATPSKPYGGFTSDLRRVEPNMRYRRYRVTQSLKELGDYGIVSTVAFPTLGRPDFWEPITAPVAKDNAASQSIFLPDACINPHPRFPTLTKNIRLRRGRKVEIRMPLFRDKNTGKSEQAMAKFDVAAPSFVGVPPSSHQASEIYMDSMGFGMGNCCLQVTFQARDLDESRYLYDQLTMLCPIFLALTAGTPILKGLLADTDARWSVIAQSVDCRTETESGASSKAARTLEGASVPQRSHGKIRKSRYDSVDTFISRHSTFRDEYNDLDSEFDQPTFDRLTASGVDASLARHVAHLYVRDPLVMFQGRVREVDDAHTTEHFESIQSTNWQTMRWKPPPLNSDMGWRVEFRPMEVQFSDFENAAFTVVVALVARVILFFDLNLYVPLSKVDENMQRAQRRDAVLKEKFHFRRHMVPLESQCVAGMEAPNGHADSSAGQQGEYFEEMSIEDIMMGKGESFPGLVPLIWAYLDIIQIDDDSRQVVDDYLNLVVQRAKGELPTPAKWMRGFVNRHPSYKQDSVIPEDLSRDLIDSIVAIGEGKMACPELLGKHLVVPLEEERHHDRLDAKLKQIPTRKLRGASFHTQMGTTTQTTYQCAVVRSLVEQYRTTTGASQDELERLKESTLSSGRRFDQAKPLFALNGEAKRSKLA